MRFMATQQRLDRALSVVGHAVPGRPTLPIEAYILATSDGSRVRFSTRREDLGIHYWMPADEVEAGSMLLPAKLISPFVGNLGNVSPSPITVTSPAPTDSASCNIRCGRINANMKNAAEDPAEFPRIPSFIDGGDVLLQLDTDLLKEIIAQVAFAAADKDSGRPAFLGVHLEIGGGNAVFAAADSFRLAVRTVPLPDDQRRQTLLLPAKTVEEMAKLLPYEGVAQLILTEDRNHALFHTEGMDLSTRLLNATFPIGFRGAIPGEWRTRAVMRRQELASLLKLMQPFALQGKKSISFKLYGEVTEGFSLDREPNTVSLEVEAQDVGNNDNMISAQVQGPDQAIDLHVQYLLEVLEIIDTTEVALEITTNARPAVIRPVGPAASDYVYVMMPVNQESAATTPAVPAVGAPVAAAFTR